MSNKYTFWGCCDFYTERDLFEQDYYKLLNLPFYFKRNSVLKLYTFYARYNKSVEKKMTHLDMLIIGLMAVGSSMTLLQLQAYLVLKNVSISMTSLKERVANMVNGGVVERNIIYDYETCENGTICKRRIVYYRLTYQGNLIAKDIGAPTCTIKKYKFFINGEHERLQFLIQTNLWNQIILNQIRYNKAFIQFFVQNVHIFPDQVKMDIPLYIKTQNGDYGFQHISKLGIVSLKHTIELWERYAQLKKKRMTVVLTVEHSDAISYIMHNLEKTKYELITIAISLVKDWYKEQSGKILMICDEL